MVVKLNEDLFMIRIEDRETRYFESLWEIPEGISYNSYLLKTEEGFILFDTVKREFSEEFLREIERITSIDEIKWLVVHHAEPDHTGAIPDLLKTNPDIEIVGHPMTEQLLKSFYRVNFKFRPVKDGEQFKSTVFYHVPWLHWPETIVSYLPKQKILLSCDVFGSFSLKKEIDEEYLRFSRKYFASVIGKYRQFVLKGLEKLEKLDIQTILPSHGLVWVRPEEIINLYEKWARSEPEKGKVLVVYTTMYGLTGEAITFLVNLLRDKGLKPVIYAVTDRERVNYAELLADAIDSEFFVIGSQTYENGLFPEMEFILKMINEKIGKKRVLALLLYGWGGVAGRRVKELLSNFDLSVIEFKGKLSGEAKEKIKGMLNEIIRA